MSRIAAETLVRLGYINVWDLAGGFEGWRGAGFPLASK
jgi:rhodanese-related sulfurtransferase